jgi:hypothetical protein
MSVAGVQAMEFAVEVGERAGKQEAELEGIVETVAQVVLPEKGADQVGVEVGEAGDVAVRDDAVDGFEEFGDVRLAGEVGALDGEEGLSRFGGIVENPLQKRFRRLRGEVVVSSFKELREQVVGAECGQSVPNLRRRVLLAVAEAARHSSPSKARWSVD